MDRLAVAQAHLAQKRALRKRTLKFASALWLSLNSWSDETADEFVATVLPVVDAAQRQNAIQTAAYVQAMTGKNVSINPSDYINVRKNVERTEVYRRPIIQSRAYYSREKLVYMARERGMQRLFGIVSTDVQLASMFAAHDAMRQSHIKHYRRVTGPNPCRLCALASTRRYNVEDLQPIHTNCQCSVWPVPASVPKELAAPVYREPENRTFVVAEHDEIGPMLQWAPSEYDAA